MKYQDILKGLKNESVVEVLLADETQLFDKRAFVVLKKSELVSRYKPASKKIRVSTAERLVAEVKAGQHPALQVTYMMSLKCEVIEPKAKWA